MEVSSIPFERAFELCKRYREEHMVRICSPCWWCLRSSKGNPVKMRFFRPKDNRGCKFVNQLYESAKKSLFR